MGRRKRIGEPAAGSPVMIAESPTERSTFLVATLSDVLCVAAKLAGVIAHLMMRSSTNHAKKPNQAIDRSPKTVGLAELVSR